MDTSQSSALINEAKETNVHQSANERWSVDTKGGDKGPGSSLLDAAQHGQMLSYRPPLPNTASPAFFVRSSEEVSVDVLERESTNLMPTNPVNKATITLTLGANDAPLSDSAFPHDPFSLARVWDALVENRTPATILAGRVAAMNVALPPVPSSHFLPDASSAGQTEGTERPWAPTLPNPLASDSPADGQATTRHPTKLSSTLLGVSPLELPSSFERVYSHLSASTPTASRLLSLRTARSHIFTREMDWLEPNLVPDSIDRDDPGSLPDHISDVQRWLSVERTRRRIIRLKPYEILSLGSKKYLPREQYAAQLMVKRRLIHGSEKVLRKYQMHDRIAELEHANEDLNSALSSALRSQTALLDSGRVQHALLSELEDQLRKARRDLTKAKNARETSVMAAKKQATDYQEKIAGLRVQLDKATWARSTAEVELAKLKEARRAEELAESVRKMDALKRAEAESRKKKLADESADELRKKGQLEAMQKARRDAEVKARVDAEVLAEARAEARRQVLEEFAERQTASGDAARARGGDAEKTEVARCSKRDAKWPKTRSAGWTAKHAVERFKLVSIEFDAIVFGDLQPLTVQSIPWPVASSPEEFKVTQLDWSAVETFFRLAKQSIPLDPYKKLVSECYFRFHPDRWSSRGILNTIRDETLRAQVQSACNAVSQAVTPLWKASRSL